MSLSQAQIELLITARSQAEAAFNQQNDLIRKLTGESDKASAGMGRLEQSTQKTGTASTATGVAIGLLADRMARGLVQGFQSAITAANRLDAGLIGLSSVASAFGQDAGKARDAAMRLAADGLMSVGDAASGLKNLLASGFALPDAIVLMERFKDTAAFGRQGALTFGQAIVSATEGIKNGNSILVDNAGITKNLSIILKEAGFAETDLMRATSDASVRQALFNGILKESQPMLGDAARLLDTAAGKQAVFSAQVEIARQAVGKGLQPALGSALDVLTPFVKVVQIAGPAVAPLAVAATGATTGLLAMKVASDWAPQLTALGEAARKAGNQALVLREGSLFAADATTVWADKSTLLKAAFAAFIGYEIGQFIGEFIVQVDEATKKTDSWTSTLGKIGLWVSGARPIMDGLQPLWEGFATAAFGAASFTEQAEAMWRASQRAGTAITSYAEAMRILAQDVNPAETALRHFNQELQKAINERAAKPFSWLDLSKLGADFTAAADAAKNSQERIDGWRSEINRLATVGALPTLRKELDLGVLSTKELATAFRTTEDAIKFYEKTLKDQEEASKRATDAEKKHREAMDALDKSLGQVGLVTGRSVNASLDEMASQVRTATAAGIPFDTIVRAIWPQLQELAAKATASGISVDSLRVALDQYGDAVTLTSRANQIWTQYTHGATEANGDAVDAARAHLREQQALVDAYHAFGLQTPEELRRVADAARSHYALLASSGTASTVQLREAYTAMVDAELEATGRIPSAWQTEVYPGITRVLSQLNTATQGTFAQMLLGAKGWKDGFVDIWHSIQSAVQNVLNEILSYFLRSFLGGLIKGMAGQQGGIATAFAGMFGGGPAFGGASGLGGIPGLAGMFGGGSSLPAGTFYGVPFGDTVLPTSAAGGGVLATGLGTAMGFAGAGAGGLGLGLLGKQLFGGAGAGAAAFGAGSGAATGALLGSVVPGLGTGIGALVGGAAGFLGGIFGKSKEAKANEAATDEIKSYQAELLKMYGSLEEIDRLGKLVGIDLAAAWGDQGTKGLQHFTGYMDQFVERTGVLQEALETYGITWQDLGAEAQQSHLLEVTDTLIAQQEALTRAGVDTTTTIQKMAPAFNEVLGAALDTGQQIPPALGPVLEQMAEMGLITEDNRRRLLGFSDDTTAEFGEMQSIAKQYGIDLAALGGKFQQSKLDDAAGKVYSAFKTLKDAGADVGGVLYGMRDEISELVVDARKFGTEIPSNMRPLIEELARSGNLIDENGDKITDLGALKFRDASASAQAQVEAMIAKLRELTVDGIDGAGEALSDTLPYWDEFSRKARLATGDADRGLDAVDQGLGTVRRQLNDTPWDEWAREGARAAADVGSEVDHLNFGHSPGGLKEIPILLAKGTQAMRAFASSFVSDLRTIDSTLTRSQGILAKYADTPIGRQAQSAFDALRGFEMDDLTAQYQKLIRPNDLRSVTTSLSREVQLMMAGDGLGKDLLGFQFQFADAIASLGPTPDEYRSTWEQARQILGRELDYQLEDLDTAQAQQIKNLGLLPDAYDTTYQKASDKLDRAYERQMADIDRRFAQEMGDLDRIVDLYGGNYSAAAAAVKAEFDDMRAEASERYEEEKERLGLVPADYREAYNEALTLINQQYDRMRERAKQRVDDELEALGPIPDEYEKTYGQALELTRQKFLLMVEEAHKAADEIFNRLDWIRKIWEGTPGADGTFPGGTTIDDPSRPRPQEGPEGSRMLDRSEIELLVAQRYRQLTGQSIDDATLASVLTSRGYTGGTVAADVVQQALDELEAEFRRQRGYATGTKAVHGDWWRNYGSEGQTVTAHGLEAFVPFSRREEFVLDQLRDILGGGRGAKGGNGGGAPIVVQFKLGNRTMEEYIIDTVNEAESNGAILVQRQHVVDRK